MLFISCHAPSFICFLIVSPYLSLMFFTKSIPEIPHSSTVKFFLHHKMTRKTMKDLSLLYLLWAWSAALFLYLHFTNVPFFLIYGSDLFNFYWIMLILLTLYPMPYFFSHHSCKKISVSEEDFVNSNFTNWYILFTFYVSGAAFYPLYLVFDWHIGLMISIFVAYSLYKTYALLLHFVCESKSALAEVSLLTLFMFFLLTSYLKN